jgi:hypothetical protein
VEKQKDEWIERHLPSTVLGVNDGEAVAKYGTAIRNACKHAREKLHLLVSGPTCMCYVDALWMFMIS